MLLLIAASSVAIARQASRVEVVTARARELHNRAIVVDTHDDTPQRMLFEKTAERQGVCDMNNTYRS